MVTDKYDPHQRNFATDEDHYRKKKTSKMQLLSPVLMDTPTIQLLNLTIETTEITSFYIGPSMHPSIHVFIHPSRQPKVLFNFSL